MSDQDADCSPVLVVGATGLQGGFAARALLSAGVAVRALVRDPSSKAARSLAAQGAELAVGSFENADSLLAARPGTRALFSMQNAPLADPVSERRDAQVLITAASSANVPQIVHTSVSGAGQFHRSMPDWGTRRWNENYWEGKADAEQMVRTAGFPRWTILKPAFMMENFSRPKVGFMFPDRAANALVAAIRPEARIVLVSAEDIGTATVAAIAGPDRFVVRRSNWRAMP